MLRYVCLFTLIRNIIINIMKSIFAVAVLAATTEASMTAGKAHYLQSKGVHMENLHAKHAKVVERATHTKNAVQKNATALRTKHQ